MGVRLRTTLTATAAVAVALALASVVLFAALNSSLEQSTREMAVQDAQQQAALVVGYRSGAPTYGTSVGGCATGSSTVTGPGTGEVTDSDAATGPPAVSCLPPSGALDEEKGTVTVTQVVDTGSGPVTVTGTASTEPTRAALSTLKGVLVPGVPALLALVALFTWLAVGRTLRPVTAIRTKVADITAHDLHARVPEPGGRDEIALLARTVNATLDRLQTAVEAHRQFVADAAHELRSPIANLRTRQELAGPPEKQLAADALDDVERLQTLTSDLLLLARLDAREPVRAVEVDLAQVVAEEAARIRPRPEIEVTLHLTADILIDGSPDRLRRLVANLVDNAVRHATTTVAVDLTRAAGQAHLDVTDDGPGIAPEHHTAVFDRFTRLDHVRTRDTGGSGLGLPIARDIATAHRATLVVLERAPGAQGAHFRAAFPLRD
jgi:signal transduction histidine kinase